MLGSDGTPAPPTRRYRSLGAANKKILQNLSEDSQPVLPDYRVHVSVHSIRKTNLQLLNFHLGSDIRRKTNQVQSSTLLLAIALLAFAMTISQPGAPRQFHFKFSTVLGYFLQDEESTDPATFDYVSHPLKQACMYPRLSMWQQATRAS